MLSEEAVRAKRFTICVFASFLGLAVQRSAAQRAPLLISVKGKIFFTHGEEDNEDPAVLRYVLRRLTRSQLNLTCLERRPLRNVSVFADACLHIPLGRESCVCVCITEEVGLLFSLFLRPVLPLPLNLVGKSGRRWEGG